MIKQVEARVVVTSEKQSIQLQATCKTSQFVVVGSHLFQNEATETMAALPIVDEYNPAYAIFTSGSTGESQYFHKIRLDAYWEHSQLLHVSNVFCSVYLLTTF